MPQFDPAQDHSHVGAFSLAELHRLPLETRAAMIFDAGRHDLLSTIDRLREMAPGLPRSMEAERLAWAIGFNVAPSNAGGDSRRGVLGYCDRWPQDTSWTVVWTVLTKPPSHENADGRSSLLGELAWSVACEHRDDWQDPASRPVERSAANLAFELVYARNRTKVVGDIYKCFGQRVGAPEAIADEAWSRVFCDYWSANARRRFLGLSRISTLVCQVARYAAVDVLREHGREEPESARQSPSLEEIGIGADPSANLIAAELESKIVGCMTRLPARQRLVAQMVWFRQLSAKKVAEVLRVSEAAVSQHLKKARETLAQCLGR